MNEEKNEMKNETCVSEVEELKERIRRAAKRLSSITKDIYEGGYIEIVARMLCGWNDFAKEYLFDHGIDLYYSESEFVDTELNETYLYNIVAAKTEKQILRALRKYASALEREYARAKKRMHKRLYTIIQNYTPFFAESKVCVFEYDDEKRLRNIYVCSSMSDARKVYSLLQNDANDAKIHRVRNSTSLAKKIYKITKHEFDILGYCIEKQIIVATERKV